VKQQQQQQQQSVVVVVVLTTSAAVSQAMRARSGHLSIKEAYAEILCYSITWLRYSEGARAIAARLSKPASVEARPIPVAATA